VTKALTGGECDHGNGDAAVSRALEASESVRVLGSPMVWVSRCDDMTDRVEGYRAALVERAIFGVYRATVDGRVLDVNSALVTMLGYESAAELLAMNMREVYADPAERGRLIRAQHGRRRFEGVEVNWRRKDGQLLMVRLTGRVVSDDNTDVFETIVEDVTRSRQWELEIRDADRLRAIGQLAGGIAHEFNNLLSIIIGHSELLLDELAPSSPGCESVREIQTASAKAAALTRQLMAFARRQPLQPQVVNIIDLLNRLQPVIHSTLRPGITLEMPAPDQSARIEVDSIQLAQVILSLAGNASDAMPNGGRLRIRVQRMELSQGAFGRGIEVSAGPFVLVTVEDTGVGMDDETKSRIFEPFFSTKRFGEGTGLGLAVVYGIVKQHGGFIFVDSEVGSGTGFRLYFRSAK
jgi:two-component system, cell cycle sensor histidine kinase and response regulator CckA